MLNILYRNINDKTQTNPPLHRTSPVGEVQCVDLAVYLGLSARHAVGVVLFQFGSSVEDFDILSWELEWLSGTRWNQTVLALGAVCVNGYHWEFFLSPPLPPNSGRTTAHTLERSTAKGAEM